MVHSYEIRVLKLVVRNRRIAKHRAGYELFDVFLPRAFVKSKIFLFTIVMKKTFRFSLARQNGSVCA
jgi:hypothetical protein